MWYEVAKNGQMDWLDEKKLSPRILKFIIFFSLNVTPMEKDTSGFKQFPRLVDGI